MQILYNNVNGLRMSVETWSEKSESYVSGFWHVRKKEHEMAEQKCAWCGKSFGDKYRESTGNPYCSENVNMKLKELENKRS